MYDLIVTFDILCTYTFRALEATIQIKRPPKLFKKKKLLKNFRITTYLGFDRRLHQVTH